MNGWTYACLVVGLLLLAAPAGALIPDKMTNVTDTPWLTAGSGSSATVTVQVSNSTSGSTLFPGVAVNFTVDITYGSISPERAVTNSEGYATAIFTPNITSGIATIAATASYEGLDKPLTGSVEQQIDHEKANKIANLWYDPGVTVGNTTEIVVRLEDKYGNPVDNRREDALNATPETVHFMVGSPEAGLGATFINGTDAISVRVDANGNATATLLVDTIPGENLVLIQPPKPIRSEYISILGVANGTPFNITCAVEPLDGSVPASGDDNDTVQLTYMLIDRYGNPAGDQNVSIVTNCADDEPYTLKSSPFGLVRIAYGPKKSAGIVNITAKAFMNESVTNSTVVKFTSTDPEDMLLTASPQTMASNDTKSGAVSEIRAKVFDVSGNPVKDQSVSFVITRVWYDDDAVGEEGPILNNSAGELTRVGGSPISATTGENGYAVVRFTPGSFPDPAPGTQRVSATGHAEVKATWINLSEHRVEQPLTLTWKNYPYLTVKTNVTPERVNVTDTVNVTIELKGDGWELQPDPINVVLCTDRSGSMLYDNPDRMHSVRKAAKQFVDNMSENDQVGLITFGRNTGSNNQIDVPGESSFDYPGYYINNFYKTPKRYLNYATVDLPLTDNFTSVKTELDNIVPDSGTPMRAGLYKSIKELGGSGSSIPDLNAIKAIILLSDGDYNYYGDPLARGAAYSSSEADPSNFGDLTKNYLRFTGLGSGAMSNQNMSFYATNNSIRIYSIAFAKDISDGGKETLEILANSTGGKYYYAPTSDDLAQIYTEIAGELKTEAGVNTTMDVIFDNVNVTGVEFAGTDVFDYVYKNGSSTHIYNRTGNEVHYKDTIDQTDDWNDDPNDPNDPKLHFDIGTIRLNQVWEATICLKVKKEGNIEIFGNSSKIIFNNGEDTLPLPATFVTAVRNLTNMGFNSASLAVNFTEPAPGSGPFTDTMLLNWTLTYNGTQNVHETLAYAYASLDRPPQWESFWSNTVGAGTNYDQTLMDVGDLPAGDYWFRVTALADDAPEAVDKTNVAVPVGNMSRTYIQIG